MEGGVERIRSLQSLSCCALGFSSFFASSLVSQFQFVVLAPRHPRFSIRRPSSRLPRPPPYPPAPPCSCVPSSPAALPSAGTAGTPCLPENICCGNTPCTLKDKTQKKDISEKTTSTLKHYVRETHQMGGVPFKKDIVLWMCRGRTPGHMDNVLIRCSTSQLPC